MHEWIGEALGRTHAGWFWLAEDDHGDLYVPDRNTWRTFQTGEAIYRTRFNRWKPWHWAPYLRSYFRGNVVMIERFA